MQAGARFTRRYVESFFKTAVLVRKCVHAVAPECQLELSISVERVPRRPRVCVTVFIGRSRPPSYKYL